MDNNEENRSSEDQVRQVQKTVHEMDRAAGDMEDRKDGLGSDIDSVRQEFRRRRNDSGVPGLPPEHEKADEPGEPSESISPAAEEPAGDEDG